MRSEEWVSGAGSWPPASIPSHQSETEPHKKALGVLAPLTPPKPASCRLLKPFFFLEHEVRALFHPGEGLAPRLDGESCYLTISDQIVPNL